MAETQDGKSRMDPALKTKWVEALRSGQYKQGQCSLRTADGSYCCLGVLCVVAGVEIAENGRDIKVGGESRGYVEFDKLGIRYPQRSELVTRNDGIQGFCGKPQSFDQIANNIEAYL